MPTYCYSYLHALLVKHCKWTLIRINLKFWSGGDYDGDRKMDDLKLLYRTYVTDCLSSGRMEEDKVTKLIFLTWINLTFIDCVNFCLILFCERIFIFLPDLILWTYFPFYFPNPFFLISPYAWMSHSVRICPTKLRKCITRLANHKLMVTSFSKINIIFFFSSVHYSIFVSREIDFVTYQVTLRWPDNLAAW